MKEFNFINAAKLHEPVVSGSAVRGGGGSSDENHLSTDFAATLRSNGNYHGRPVSSNSGSGGTSSDGSSSNSRSKTNRMLILSSELQLNLLEKDNKSQVDGKIVAKREIKSEHKQNHSTRNNSNPQIAFNVNINRSANKNLNPYAAINTTITATTALNRTGTKFEVVQNDGGNGGGGGGRTSTSSIYQPQMQLPLNKIPNEAIMPVKYNHMRTSASTSMELDAAGYETRQSASTMELECIAGYDGGLPQQFVLEAYDSRTKKLRLNVTSAYTDVPLFRFDLSGKLIKFILFVQLIYLVRKMIRGLRIF